MSTEHPITPTPELVREWLCQDGYPWDPDLLATITITTGRLRRVATQAARWGADQELEACVEWLRNDPVTHEIVGREARYLDFDLYDARRPKPPSLKERALEALETEGNGLSVTAASVIRRALEQLDD